MLNSKSTSRLLAVLCLNVKTMSEKCAIYDKIRGFQKYLVECEKSPNTIRCYLFAITNFLLSQKNDGEPDALSIVKWKQALMQQYSPATVNLRLSAMRSYCKYRGISCNIKLLKVQRSTSAENVITLEMYKNLLSGLLKDGNRRWAAYYKILAMSGVRCSELLQIRKKDLEHHTISLFTKGKIRQISFPSKLVDEVIGEFASMADDDYICVNRCGNRLSPGGVRTMLKKHAEQYGIPRECAHPHSFRHLFAIEFLKCNKDLMLLSDLLGHSNVNTTGIYLQLSREQQRRVLDKTVTW